MTPSPTHGTVAGGTVRFTAPCPACHQQVEWVARPGIDSYAGPHTCSTPTGPDIIDELERRAQG